MPRPERHPRLTRIGTGVGTFIALQYARIAADALYWALGGLAYAERFTWGWVQMEFNGQPDGNLGISRRQLIKRGAIVGGTVVWAAPVVQSFTAPAYSQTLYQLCCRFTGGGGSGGDSGLTNVVHYGFELYCGPNPPAPNNFTVTFIDEATGKRVTFHLESNYTATCAPPPTTTPDAPCSQITGGGSGRVTGPGATDGSSATFTFELRDEDPGRGETGGDFMKVCVTYTNKLGQLKTFCSEGIPTGNIQAHEVHGSKANCA